MQASASGGALAEWKRFWPLPLAAAFGYSTNVLHVYGIGPFIQPLQEEFGWSRSETTLGLSIAAAVSGLFAVPSGMLIDRIGPRIIGLIGVVAMCACFALLGTATGGLLQWIALWCILSIGVLWVQATVWSSAVATRFKASRGLALAITLSGASLAAVLFPIIATWFITHGGWRMGFMGMAGVWCVVTFPMLLLFFRGAKDVKRKSRSDEAEATPDLPGMSIKEGARTPAFYKLLLASGLFALITMGMIVHFVPILTSYGAEPMAAAGVAALVGVFSLVGRLTTGFLLDRFPARYVGAIAFLLPIVASAALILDGANPVNQMIAAATFGLTLGSEVDVIVYLTTRHFGLKNFGALYGAMQVALAVGLTLGPLAAAAAFDQFGGYSLFLMFISVMSVASSLALASLPNPTFDETAADKLHEPAADSPDGIVPLRDQPVSETPG